jgi:capsular exopolysaccharide synthesis family protein
MSDNTPTRESREEFVSIGEFLAFIQRWRSTIAGTAVLVVALAVAFTLTRTPVYRASATLRLEKEGKGEGVLSDLAALTSAPAAESEIALLQSRSLAAEVVAAPARWDAPDMLFRFAEHDRFQTLSTQSLDLATVIQSEYLSPLASLQRRFGATTRGGQRLFASFETGDAGSVDELRVTFVGEDRVRVARPGFLGWGESGEQELPYSPEAPIAYEGITLRLRAVGDYVGQSFRIWRDSRRDAVETFMRNTSVRETARNSGVLNLTVEDADPNRAAESANALAQNYILRSVRLGSLRAERTLGFVDEELKRVLAHLDTAEQEVVAQSAQHLRAINVSATSKAMIDALAGYEAEKARVSLSRRSLTEALDQIAEGELRGLSLLSPELSDPLTLSHVKAIGELRASAAGIDRSDAGPYKLLLQRDLATLQLERERLSLQAQFLAKSISDFVAGDSVAITQLAGENASVDPVALGYLSEISSLEAELARLEEVVTEKHADYISRSAARSTLVDRLLTHTRTQLARLEGRLAEHEALIGSHERALLTWASDERGRIDDAANSLLSLVKDNLTSQIAGLDTRGASLDEAIGDIERQLGNLPEDERRLADPLRRREAFDRIAKMLLESQQQAQLARAATMPSAVLIDPAVPPVERTSPRVLMNVGLALLLGSLLGLCVAWLRNALLDSLHTQASVEEASGLSVIGSIPDFRRGPLRARGASAHFIPMRDDNHGVVAEHYRSIREALRFSLDTAQRVRTFGATSCVANEGKTVTNIDMAMAFSGGSRRVLLIDADMRKPSIGEYFDDCEGTGFAEALERRVPWQESIRSSHYAGLDLLPAGMPSTSPNDLLRDDYVRQLLEEFRDAYDHVVFDLPPALIVSDVETFAGELDAVALVYRTGGVSRGMLVRTVQRMRQSGVDLAGVILNFVRPSHGEGYGNYGYGYGYGTSRMEQLGRKSG